MTPILNQTRQKTQATFALEQNPLLLNPQLAAAIGVDEAIVLGQIHYWISKGCGLISDGVRWIYNTYQQWLEQFPFFSLWRLRKAMVSLRESGLVRFQKLESHRWNHTGHYTINYEQLKALRLPICGLFTDASADCSQADLQTAHRTETEITPETNPKTTAVAAAVLDFEEENVVTPLATLETQAELVSQETEPTCEDNSSVAVPLDEILDAVDAVGIEINPQMRSLLMTYTLEQVNKCLDYYRQTKREKSISNPAGWVVECLRGQWWVNNVTSEEEARVTAGKWVNWARSKGLVDYSTDDSRYTGYPAGVRCCIGQATAGKYEPWEEVARRYPLGS